MIVDSYERKINYARISVTDLCNLRCLYCMPNGICKKQHSDILTIEQLEAVSDALAELGISKQRLTGGEPLLRRGIMTLVEHIGANPLVEKLCVTTNGQLLGTMSRDLKAAGVKAVNISIDTIDADKYAYLTKGGSLNTVLDGIEAALAEDFETVKLNAVLLKGVNDGDVKELADFARKLGVPIRFIEYMPFGQKAECAEDFFISSKDIIQKYALTCVSERSGNDKTSVYAFPDGTEVGFISPISDKFCSDCNRVRTTADGKLLNCLHESREFDFKPYIGDKEALKAYISECIKQKPQEHHITEGVLQERDMERIGG